MPIYEYKCEGCGAVFEVLQRMSDPPPEKHEACGSTEVHRVMSPAAFVFKGDGWYVTDYARKDKDKKGGGSGSSSSSSGSSSSSSGSSGSPSGSSGSGASTPSGGSKTAAA